MRIVTRRVAVSLGSALLAASLMLGTAACSDDDPVEDEVEEEIERGEQIEDEVEQEVEEEVEQVTDDL